MIPALYPAELAFRRDRRLARAPRRVYEYLTTELDFTEARPVKILVSEQIGIRRATMTDALDTLVGGGYLIEHARDSRNVRRFTLAWSINPDRLRAG